MLLQPWKKTVVNYKKKKRVTVISIGQKGNYLSGLMTTQRYWGAGLDIDFSASFQFEKNSQTLASQTLLRHSVPIQWQAYYCS